MNPSNNLTFRLDQFPPWPYTLIYGVQWMAIFLPTLMILSAVSSEYLGLQPAARILFFQRVLLTTGGIMILQTLWGHRYPLLDGPSSALLLSLLLLAPGGIAAIQGGMIAGGIFLLLLGVFRLTRALEPLFTDNVIGVTLILIALTLLPFLAPLMTGMGPRLTQGDPVIMGISLCTIILIAVFSHWLTGFWRTISLLWGIVAGTILTASLGRLHPFGGDAPWMSFPWPLYAEWPAFPASAVLPFILSYLAVIINGVGSIYSIGEVVGREDMPGRVARGIGLTGFGGVLGGFLGAIGTVSFGISPGVVLVTRVGSRYPVTCCGFFLFVLAFFPKILILLMSTPPSVVAAALVTAMSSQVGAGISVLTRSGRSLEPRDYLVIGIPLLMGGILSILPERFFQSLPSIGQPILKNGLVGGIILVLFLEHILLRRKRVGSSGNRPS